MQIKQKLDALTSLRFFAALMIVIHHSIGLFGFSKENYPPFMFGQAVSFFFVLSGFILAYVYPKLETWSDVCNFWRARIARVWPALFATLILAIWLLSLSWDYKTGLSNILMVNAWIPYPAYYFSYNSPSWSISTEFFFYLAFPFLIYKWDKTWLIKLLISGAIVVLLILVSNILKLPSYVSIKDDDITNTALLYIHPASRIFEFVFGIYIASLWRKKVDGIQWSRSRATFYEVGVIFLVGISMHFAFWAKWIIGALLGLPASTWFGASGSMFAFGLLIYVIAIGRGRVSAYLCHPTLILLGEISFSIYLIHQILLRYYQANITIFPHLHNSLLLVIFLAVLLLASYLMWAFIEMPGRRFIIGREQKKIHATKAMRESWKSHLNLNRKTLSASTILSVLIAAIYFSMGNVNRISAYDADVMTTTESQSLVGTRFSDLFSLRGIQVIRKNEGLTIDLAWESLVEQKLAYTNGIHLTDVNGNMIVPADYKQPMSRTKIKQGVIWKDTIFIPAGKLSGKESKLAIALYPHNHPEKLLPVDRGNRDWGNRRLLIDLGSVINPYIPDTNH